MSAQIIRDNTPEDRDDYPNIDYWEKGAQLDEKARRAELAKSVKPSRRRGRGRPNPNENLTFWHFQHSDGRVLDGDEVSAIRRESKKIWRGLCHRYGPIGAPWSTISPDRQLEFYIKIEEKFPILRLCEHHYKAETIAFADYSHWYDKIYPYAGEEDIKPVSYKTTRTGSRKRTRTASPMKTRQSAKKARYVSPVQNDNDDDTSSYVPEESVAGGADTDTDQDQDKDMSGNADSDPGTNADKQDTPPPSILSTRTDGSGTDAPPVRISSSYPHILISSYLTF